MGLELIKLEHSLGGWLSGLILNLWDGLFEKALQYFSVESSLVFQMIILGILTSLTVSGFMTNSFLFAYVIYYIENKTKAILHFVIGTVMGLIVIQLGLGFLDYQDLIVFNYNHQIFGFIFTVLGLIAMLAVNRKDDDYRWWISFLMGVLLACVIGPLKYRLLLLSPFKIVDSFQKNSEVFLFSIVHTTTALIPIIIICLIIYAFEIDLLIMKRNLKRIVKVISSIGLLLLGLINLYIG